MRATRRRLSLGGDGDVVLTLIDPRRSRASPLSVRGVLSLGAQDAQPLAVQARVHERQWLLHDDDNEQQSQQGGCASSCATSADPIFAVRACAPTRSRAARCSTAPRCVVDGVVRVAANGAVRLVGGAGNARVRLVSSACRVGRGGS
jgi:hypothetical protein